MNSKFLARLHVVVASLSAAFVLASGFAGTSTADELYGKVRDVVTDASGAAVPDVELILTNEGTNVAVKKSTGSEGVFEFVNLQPGSYTLVATKPSFSTFRVHSIRVEANQVYVRNVTMALGAVSETIQVEANPVQVEQTSIQLSSTIDSKAIVDLPLIGRNWITLQQTMPGVVTPDTRFGTNYSANGSQAQQNSYLINGNDYNDLPLNSPLAVPNPDTIQEVKMVTNTINPEFGRNSGAVINGITKSGTNSFHGTAFWFYRDTFLNTHNFFSQSVPVFHQNLLAEPWVGQYGKIRCFSFMVCKTPGPTNRNPVFGSRRKTTLFTHPLNLRVSSMPQSSRRQRRSRSPAAFRGRTETVRKGRPGRPVSPVVWFLRVTSTHFQSHWYNSSYLLPHLMATKLLLTRSHE